ncbi:hypothetical protein BDP27DRAFT_647378 [Rhodocollybia butyracea]|uniref:Uncharacterized protein n=1 Tax=Rhodocollybia butyracea TaxID=206335 RepID=A0A9P5PY28_9AGAR|nr:hypothetical protein BDP27DRAFT_647378 [Rhodocollybia butyracea]
MATSSESWSKTATTGSDIHGEESSPTSPSPALRQQRSHKLSSFYSLITCKSDSLFSNSSHKTVNNPTSNSSTTSISNTGEGNPVQFPVLKQAKSVSSMKGLMWPSTSTGPSLPRSHSFTVRLRKKYSWPGLVKGDEAELQDSGAESPTGTPNTSTHDLERGGQGSRPRRTSKLKQLIYQPGSSSNHTVPTTDPSDAVSRLSTKRPTVVKPTLICVVGEGLDSKRRDHTKPSPTSIASPHTIDTIISSAKRCRITSSNPVIIVSSHSYFKNVED